MSKDTKATDNQADAYDEAAEAFAQQSENLPTWVHIGRPAMIAMLAPFFNRDDVTMLDLGSASGRVERFLIDNGITPSNITGIEISPEQVGMAQRRFPEINFQVGDVSTVELPENNFDVAISHMVFEHLNDEQLLATFVNTHRALKPEGTFAFVVTHPDKITASDGITEKGAFVTSAPWGGELVNYFRFVPDFVAALEQAGFTNIEVSHHPIPEVANAEGLSQQDYEHYAPYGNVRLAIKATKPKN